MPFCTKCGAEVAPNIKFCTKCGKPMGAAAKPKEIKKEVKQEVKKEPIVSKPSKFPSKLPTQILAKPKELLKTVVLKPRQNLGVILIISGAIVLLIALIFAIA